MADTRRHNPGSRTQAGVDLLRQTHAVTAWGHPGRPGPLV